MIGLDLDNTLVCYDEVFHGSAVELGLIPASVAPSKDAVRRHLREAGREGDWTWLQGEVYGPRMQLAQPFPGAEGFVATRDDLCIVSHKTRVPARGPAHDLHASARAWLSSRTGFQRVPLYLEETQRAKVERISTCGCLAFVDDLPELLMQLPASLTRILFDPQGAHPEWEPRAGSWEEVARLVAAL